MAVSHTAKFPWQPFRNAWEQGLAGMFVPAQYKENPKSSHFNDHRKQLIRENTQLKKVLYGHYPLQISLAEGASKELQDKYFPLMSSLPIVAASPLYKANSSDNELTFRITGQNITLSGQDVPYRNAEVASMFLVEAFAESSPTTKTMFVVDKHALGIELKKNNSGDELAKHKVSFHDVIIPRDHMIGKVGEGSKFTDLTAEILQLD